MRRMNTSLLSERSPVLAPLTSRSLPAHATPSTKLNQQQAVLFGQAKPASFRISPYGAHGRMNNPQYVLSMRCVLQCARAKKKHVVRCGGFPSLPRTRRNSVRIQPGKGNSDGQERSNATALCTAVPEGSTSDYYELG